MQVRWPICHSSDPSTMTQEKQEAQEKPVFGASGRKIVYDKDGKPYVTSHFCEKSESIKNLITNTTDVEHVILS